MVVRSRSDGDRALASAGVAIASNVVRQGIGIVSVLVLARLLTPEDYGLVAAALLVVQFFDVLSQTGTDPYVLSRTALTSQELNTAWTLRLLVRLGAALLVVVLAPSFANFFELEALTAVLLACAVVPVIDAFQSPGLLLLRRDFRYRGIAALDVTAKLVSFAISIGIAWWLRSYWALVAGSLTTAVVMAAGSYRLHPARPAMTLAGARAQWGFSKWTLARALVGYMRAKVDNIIIARGLGVVELGTYTVAKQLATMPHMYITESLRDILVSSVGGSETRRTSAATTLACVICALLSLLLPIVVGAMLVADLVVIALLGERWAQSGEVFRALLPLTLTFTLCGVVSNALVAIGRLRRAFILDVTTLILVAGTMLAAFELTEGVAGFAWMRTLAGVAVAGIFYAILTSVLQLQHRDLIISMIPACIATIIMAAVVMATRSAMLAMPMFAALIALAIIGAITYLAIFALVLAVWRQRTPEMRFIVVQVTRLVDNAKNRVSTSAIRTDRQSRK